MNSAPTAEMMGSIPVRNAWHMLLYAWDMVAWRGTHHAEAEGSPSLLGLLARVLAASTRKLLRRELARSFAEQGETVRGVRGRVDFARSLKRLEFEAGRAHCAFSSLDVDTLRNQILRTTLERLGSDPRVDHVDAKKAAELRHEIRDLVRAMDGVTPIQITKTAFSRLQLTRMDRSYALPLAICALLHRLEMPTECSGDHALTALARDQITFHSLFERFVRNFWRLHLSLFDVKSEVLSWPDDVANEYAPSMRTDMTLVSRTAPHRRVIVDTKYTASVLCAGPHGALKFRSEHLYQLYAYLRTQEDKGEPHRQAEGILLYPTARHHLDETMVVQGHRLRVATVDLAQSWEQVEERLVALVAPGAGAAG